MIPEIQTYNSFFQHYIQQLKTELETFPNEAMLWETHGSISNSAGNLSLHLAGNLQHFIGHVIGKSGYIRNRPFEFEAKNISLDALLKELDITADIVEKTLNTVSQSDLEADFPIEFSHKKSSTRFNLMRFVTHLSYHVGQVNYLRRMSEREKA